MSKETKTPTAAELEILTILWEKEPLAVKDIHQKLSKVKDVGYTTTLKIMQNMTAKGLLDRELAGKSHLYTAAYKQEDTQQNLLDRLLDTAFGGSATSLVMQLLGNKNTSQKELQKIKEIIKDLDEKKS